MDGDSCKEIQSILNVAKNARKHDASILNAGDVFQPLWFRRYLRYDDKADRLILDRGYLAMYLLSALFFTLFLLRRRKHKQQNSD